MWSRQDSHPGTNLCFPEAALLLTGVLSVLPPQMHSPTPTDQAKNPSSSPHWLCDLGEPLKALTYSTLLCKVWSPGSQQNCWVGNTGSR